MSIKYNSVADIPEDLKWIAERELPDNDFYQKLGDRVVGADSPHNPDLACHISIWFKDAVEAAKECLARCESEGEAVKWPGVGDVCEIAGSTDYLKISHKEGMKVKVYASFIDDRGVDLRAWVSLDNSISGGVCVPECFRTIKTESELAAEKAAKEREDWVNKILNRLSSEKNYEFVVWEIGAVYDAMIAIKGSE